MRSGFIILITIIICFAVIFTFFALRNLVQSDDYGSPIFFQQEITFNLGNNVNNPLVYSKSLDNKYLVAAIGFTDKSFSIGSNVLCFVFEFGGSWSEFFDLYSYMPVREGNVFIAFNGISSFINTSDFNYLIPVNNDITVLSDTIQFDTFLSHDWNFNYFGNALASVFFANVSARPTINTSDIFTLIKSIFVDYPNWVLSFITDVISIFGGAF